MERQPAHSNTATSTQPFWERYGLCSERSDSEAGCSYTSFINLQCRLEESAKGSGPTRKCERLIRKFRDCGKGREEIESTTEEIIDHNIKPGSSSDWLTRERAGSGAQQMQSTPLDSNVGEALEEFVEYAEKLKRRAAGVPESSGVTLDDNYTSSQKRLPDLPVQYDPWYTRLFHRRAAQCSPGRQRPWENFKKDFQEV